MLGRIGAPHGVRGWSQVWSYADPPQGLLRHRRFTAVRHKQTRTLTVVESRAQGDRLQLRFDGIEDRDAAALLTGFELGVPRSALQAPPAGSWYWCDLVGLSVVTMDGTPLGRVQGMIETGAHDVLVVTGERERLIPFVYPQIVKQVDLDAGRIDVDWEAEY
ncbi:MAG: ribosome maturation factor RimM [Immundisolibacter sp.]